MGWKAADNSTMQQMRDTADGEHKQYWSQNNFSPTGSFARGYERGWADTKAAKEAGMNVDSDYEAFAKKRMPECHVDEQDWEWRHGHIQGQKDCLKAGHDE